MKDMKTMKKLLLIALFIIVPFNLLAGDFWKYLWGPEGGTIRDLFSLNGRIFIDTDNGHYRSDDFGRSWKWLKDFYYYGKVMSYPDGSLIRFIRYGGDDSHKGDLVYYRSTNNGDTWQVNFFDEDYGIDSFTPDNLMPIYAMDNNNNVFGVIFKSDSILSYSVPDLKEIVKINSYKLSVSKAFYKRDYYINQYDEMVIIGYVDYIDEGFIFISPDSGRSWQYIETPYCVFKAEFITNEKIVIATTYGVYYSEDKGETWNATNIEGFSKYLCRNSQNELFANGIDDDYFSVFKSVDSGKTWQIMTLESENTPFENMISLGNGELYAGNWQGFFYSRNGGRTWTESNKGIVSTDVKGISYDSEGSIFVTANGRVLKSSDDGITWRDLKLVENSTWSVIYITRDDYIIVSSNSGSYKTARSTDGGESWEYRTRSEFSTNASPNSFFENSRGQIYMAHDFGNKLIYSTDKGITWQKRSIEGDTYSFAMNSEGHIFRGSDNGQIYRSTDDGETWAFAKMNYFLNGITEQEIRMLLFDKYSNGYSHWNIRTSDNGRSWFRDSLNYPRMFLGVDSLNRLIGFHGRADKFQRLKSTDDFYDWSDISTGLIHGPSQFNFLSVSPEGYIYFAEKDAGLYRSEKTSLSVENEIKTIVSGEINISPCPATDFIDLKFRTSTIAPANISVYNQLGAKVYMNTTFSAVMEHNTSIPLRDFPAGIYYIRIETGNDIISGMFVKE